MEKSGKERIAAEFDSKAESYESNRLAPWYQAQGRAVLQELPPGAEGTLLDVGCGTGWLLRRAVEAHPGLRGVGIDLSPGMIRSARIRAKGADRLQFHSGDWEQDAFELPPVRYAVCVSAMHYFEDPRAAFAKIHGALENGGSLLLLDRAKEGSLITSAWDLLHRVVIRDDCRFFSTAELLELMTAAGLADPYVVERIEKWFWHGKLRTSLALLRATTGARAR